MALAELRGEIGAGVPIKAAVAHRGADLVSRELNSWRPGLGSADSDLLPELDVLRGRGRDLERNHAVASGVVQTLVDNVAGTGLRLMASPDYRALGRPREWAKEWARQVEALWRGATETIDFDASRKLNFAGATALVYRSKQVNGEALALPLWLPRRGRKTTVLQIIESDRLGNPWDLPDSERLRGGVEIDDYGAPVAYHIRAAHPGDDLFGGFSPLVTWKRVPAWTAWGRPRVIHAFDKHRPGQTRGKPIFAAVMTDFRMLDHYQRTELKSAIVNAMIAAFIKTQLPQDEILNLFGGQVQDYLDARAEHKVRLEGGALLPLFPGDDVQPFIPGRPPTGFAAFMEHGLRSVAAGLNVPYELLLKDFSKTNYSSARAALLEAWRYFNGQRQWLVLNWAQPVYELFLEEWVNLGLIEAPGFYENRAAYARGRWIGPGRGWVDPVKEVQASQIRLDAGLSTLADECAEQGLDWEEVLEQRAAERERMRELGLLDAAERSASRPVAVEPEKREEEP